MSDLVPLLAPVASFIRGLDLSNAEASRAALERAFAGTRFEELEVQLRAAHTSGSLTPREAGGVHFGRIAKAGPETYHCTIDVVDIACAGAEHSHPDGEVSLCFDLEGDPRFDGHASGWVVLPPGSHHAPTVTGGRMLIVYFLPNGSVRWGPMAD